VYVGTAKITLAIGHSQSLKDKRAVVRRIKDRIRDKLGVAINEVGELDVWQRAELGCAVTSGDRRKALELIDEVIRAIGAIEDGASIIAIAKDATTFDAPSVPVADKPADNWVPDAWKDLP
jgi:hypothetical protein